jgi:hypothetical protein
LSTHSRATLEMAVSGTEVLPDGNMLVLNVEHPHSPSEFGTSDDTRKLGFQLTRLSIYTARQD